MFRIARRIIANVLNVIDLIFYHLLVVIVNARKLISFLVRGTQTWIIMTGRLFMFVCIIGIGWYRLVKYWVLNPLILRNVEYGRGGKYRNLVDVYLPFPHNPMNNKYGQTLPSSPAPVVIFVSGGAWIIGYKMWSCLVARGLSYLGIVTIVPDYRNFPQGDIEDMMADIRAVVQWATFNASRFGGDPNKIVLAGQSAGAHICTCLLVDDYLKQKNQGQYFNTKEVNEDTVVNGISVKEKRRRDSESGYDDVLAATFNASKHIKLFIGVSGPYNLYALVTHLKNRGLDPSIMDYVCRGDVIKYSPTIQLAEYCHAQAGSSCSGSDKSSSNEGDGRGISSKDGAVSGRSGGGAANTSAKSPATPIVRGRASGAESTAAASAAASTTSSSKKKRSTKSTGPSAGEYESLGVAVPSADSSSRINAAAAAGAAAETEHTSSSSTASAVTEEDSPTSSSNDLQFVFFSTPPRGSSSASGLGSSGINRPPLAPIPVSTPGAVIVYASSVVNQPGSSYKEVVTSKPPMYAHVFPNVHKFLSTDDLKSHHDSDGNREGGALMMNSAANSTQYLDKYAAPSTNFLISSNGHDQQVVATPTAHLADFPPVVLFHGAKDQSIPLTICSDLRDLLALHGACVDLKVYPHWTHTDAILEAPLSGNMRLFHDMAECIDNYTGSNVMELNRTMDESQQQPGKKRAPLEPMVSAYCVAIARRVNPF